MPAVCGNSIPGLAASQSRSCPVLITSSRSGMWAVTQARKAGIRFIITEPQYPNKGAKLIAAQLGVPTIELDPYAEDYFTMLRRTAKLFSEAPQVK